MLPFVRLPWFWRRGATGGPDSGKGLCWFRRFGTLLVSVNLASVVAADGPAGGQPVSGPMVVIARAIPRGACDLPCLPVQGAANPLGFARIDLERIARRGRSRKTQAWLYEEWKDRQLRYVFLVGDADLVPVHYMVLDRVTPHAFDYAFYPSDLYYADVARRNGSFDDWNARKDGFHADYFGEVRGEKNKTDPVNFDEIDYRPELAVGRWPVDSEAEVRTVVEKTITEDRAARSGNGPGMRGAALCLGAGLGRRAGQDQPVG